jgi:hypothetical protein
LSIGLMTLLVWENWRFDQKFGGVAEGDDAEGGCENDGPGFEMSLESIVFIYAPHATLHVDENKGSKTPMGKPSRGLRSHS